MEKLTFNQVGEIKTFAKTEIFYKRNILEAKKIIDISNFLYSIGKITDKQNLALFNYSNKFNILKK